MIAGVKQPRPPPRMLMSRMSVGGREVLGARMSRNDPSAIGNAPDDRQGERQNDHIGDGHPFDEREGRSELFLDRRQRDVDDGHIERRHRRADENDSEDRPLPSTPPLLTRMRGRLRHSRWTSLFGSVSDASRCICRQSPRTGRGARSAHRRARTPRRYPWDPARYRPVSPAAHHSQRCAPLNAASIPASARGAMTA